MTGNHATIRRHPERALALPDEAERILSEAGVDYAAITEREDKATRLLEVVLDAVSAKGRSGGPRGPFDAGPATPGSAGIVPLSATG